MEYTKQSIRAALAAGKQEEAANTALAYAEYTGLTEIVNALLVLNAKAKDLHQKWGTGLLSYADFSLHYAQVNDGLAQWIDRLPDQAVPATRRRKLLTESTFKGRVFFLLCAIKIIVILRLAYHWSTGGFNNDQFQATATLLAPTLAAYISVMLADYIRQHQKGPTPPRYLSGPLVTFSYWLFPIYAILLLFFIEMKAKSSFSFSQMNFWLAMVESVLGGYVGRIVFAFFKKE